METNIWEYIVTGLILIAGIGFVIQYIRIERKIKQKKS
jgi:hypothetical protein